MKGGTIVTSRGARTTAVRPDVAALADAVLAVGPAVRYVAISVRGETLARSAPGRAHASGEESDWYEEKLVNPTILDLAARRGAIGCGGLDDVLIRYGHFFQLLVPLPAGFVSICLEPEASPMSLLPSIMAAARDLGARMQRWQPAGPQPALMPEPYLAGDEPTRPERRLLAALYGASELVRYVALRRRGRLTLTSRVGDPASGDDRSDRYEELLVNPTLVAIAGARGAIDCGGLRYLVVGYAAFHALIVPIPDGHVTISLPRDSDPVALAPIFEGVLAER